MDSSNDNIVIIVENQRFNSSRAALIESSQYFRALLTGSFQESQSPELEIVDVSAYWFGIFLEYLVSRELEIHPCHAVELLILCDRFHVESMVARCENSIEANFNTVDKFRLLDVAVMLNRDKFKTKLWMHFYLKLSQEYDDKNANYSNPDKLFLCENRERIAAISLEAQSFILKCVTHVEFKKARLIQMKNYQDIEKHRLLEENASLTSELVRSVKKTKKLEGRLVAMKEIVQSTKREKHSDERLAPDYVNYGLFSDTQTPRPLKIKHLKHTKETSSNYSNFEIHSSCTVKKGFPQNVNEESEFVELPVCNKKDGRVSSFSKLMKKTIRKRLFRNKYDFTV